MKKTLTIALLAVMSMFTFTLNAASSITPATKPTPAVEINKMSFNDILNITPEKYTELTGQKLSFVEKAQLKIVQKVYNSKAGKFIPQPKEGGGKGLNIVALILGILTILFFWLPLINLLFALPAIICGAIGFFGKKPGKVMGLIGAILALIGAFWFLF